MGDQWPIEQTAEEPSRQPHASIAGFLERSEALSLRRLKKTSTRVMIHADLVLSRAILARFTFAKISYAVLVHTYSFGEALRWVIYASMAAISSEMLRNTPRRICSAVRSPRTRSTRLNHELLVGVKCMWTRRWRVSHR